MKMITIKSIAFAGILAIILFSCKKDDIKDTSPSTPVDTTSSSGGPYNVSLPGASVTLSVAGRITDENNNPVSGANCDGRRCINQYRRKWNFSDQQRQF